jgi:hypothetical protein
MIAKAIYLRWTMFHHLSDRLGPTLESPAARKEKAQIHQREAGGSPAYASLISAIKTRRLIENQVLPFPKLSTTVLG